jgi:hypothetical protein
MESLEILEKKIVQLIQTVQKMQTDNAAMLKENGGLKKKLSALEESVLKGTENIESLAQEKEKTKLYVSDLIKNIDQLIEGKI